MRTHVQNERQFEALKDTGMSKERAVKIKSGEGGKATARKRS
jgi:hypothetical protein